MTGSCDGYGRCCGFQPSSEGRGSRDSRSAGARYGLALAGGYAVSAHGMGNRPSGDVDLFTSWQRRGEFPELAERGRRLARPRSRPARRGSVLHADDAVANKVCALFGRALPRDFLDVDAAVTSGRYTQDQLLELAAEADHGFDRLLFADALGALTQITDAAFAEYRADPRTTADMRRRFAQWRHDLLASHSS
jgi:hypothetical protein